MGYLTRLIGGESRSIENPNVPLDSDEAYEMLGARKSESGVRVTPKTMMEFSPLFRGIDLISTIVGKIPLEILKRTPDGRGKERATDHPSYNGLRYKANDEMTAFQFRKTMQGIVMIFGNAYAWLRRDGAARVLERIIIHPKNVTLVRENGKLIYLITIGGDLASPNSIPFKARPDEILHIRGLGDTGLSGFKIVSLASTSIGSAIASERFTGYYMSNHAKMGAVIQVPGQLEDKAYNRLHRDWNRMNSNLNESHRTAILEEGAQLQPFADSAKEAQLLESKKQDIVTASNWTGAPVHKMGGDGRTAFKSLEEENQNFLDEGIDGHFVNWEQETREKELTEAEKRADSHVVEFNRNALVRANLVKRFGAYRTALGGAPFMSKNEVRALENMNPVEGGDEILLPLNMAAPGDQADEPADKPAEDQEGDNVRALFESLERAKRIEGVREILVVDIRRAVRRLAVQLRKADKQNDRDRWTWASSEELRGGVREILAPSFRLVKNERLFSGKLDGLVDDLVDRFRAIPDEVSVSTWIEDRENDLPAEFASKLTEPDLEPPESTK